MAAVAGRRLPERARACPEFAFEVARRGYAVGATVLEAVLPAHDGPTATVPVSMSDDGLEQRDGVEAKSVVVKQLGAALEILRQYQPVRITTLGGECSVSVAPFSELATATAMTWPSCGSTCSRMAPRAARLMSWLTSPMSRKNTGSVVLNEPDVQSLAPIA